MLIMTLEPSTHVVQGDQLYRTHQPSQALAELPGVYALCSNWLHPDAHALAEIADVLVLCQSIDVDFLPLMQRRRRAKRLTVVEFNDDFLHPDPNHAVASFYRDPVTRSLALQMASLADRLQFSSAYLADQLAYLNPQHAVFPNAVQLDTAQPKKNAQKPGEQNLRVKLGWAGSLGHWNDLCSLMPVLQRIMQRLPFVDLQIMGDSTFKNLFDWVPAHRFGFQPSGSFSAYQTFLGTLDVGMAPLLDTPFNRSRSDVKFLEYTSQGVAGVFSNSPAYQKTIEHQTTGLLADSLADFESQIEALLTDVDLRHRLVHNAQKQVFEQRTRAAMAKARLDFWDPKSRCDNVGVPSHLEAFGVTPKMRYLRLPEHPAQTRLHQGLSSPWQQAYPLLLKAIESSPDFYLPHLYAGHRHPDLDSGCAHLEKALAINPASIATRYHLADKQIQQQRYQQAHQTLDGAFDNLPSGDDFSPIFELKGRLHLVEGKTETFWFQKALGANPWYRLPATRLAQHMLQIGQIETAQKLLQENLTYEPKHWLDYFLLGQIALQQQQWGQGKQFLEQARKEGGPIEHVAPLLAKTYAHLGQIQSAKQLLHQMQRADSKQILSSH